MTLSVTEFERFQKEKKGRNIVFRRKKEETLFSEEKREETLFLAGLHFSVLILKLYVKTLHITVRSILGRNTAGVHLAMRI